MWSAVVGNCALAVEMPEPFAAMIQALAERPFESGGVLVGRYTEDHTTAKITGLLDTVEGDDFAVTVGTQSTRKLAELWEESKGTTYYLGDWHTHPGPCEPSSLDAKTGQQRAEDHEAKCPACVSLICGRDGWSCRVYLRGKDPVDLMLVI